MVNEKKLSDIVQNGTLEDIEKKLRELQLETVELHNFIIQNNSGDEVDVVLVNLLIAQSEFIEICGTNIHKNISVIALGTRSLYELLVRIKTIISNSEQVKKWSSEAITDNIQILEGILTLGHSDSNEHNTKALNDRIEHLKITRDKYELPEVKQPMPTGNLVDNVGLRAEHDGMYKLYSKLVHPSSFLVNFKESADTKNVRDILLIHAQLYSIAAINSIGNYVGFKKS
ncbi:DUF5677 domain-containing protein [Moritella sp. F3]|uniref:DUF5677 domain-containing protein n=1 Tax=Moritella sp. F3 TaxID=2718882 RepID=UPI0018E1C477|nr:DUF5677 domain-containing protein [Moritella sp. F3]GIC79360.1 hypothetical protein FMO001_40870 [Moritella sp. F1]GIC84079.1 hypothetical protein FMO003_43590 [Moritella sp. F3]